MMIAKAEQYAHGLRSKSYFHTLASSKILCLHVCMVQAYERFRPGIEDWTKMSDLSGQLASSTVLLFNGNL